jgi:hypothetical protein
MGAGFKKSGGSNYNKPSGGYQQRSQPQTEERKYESRDNGNDEYKAERVTGLFRRQSKYGTFWSSPSVDGYEYRVSLNPNYEKDPERQNEYILWRAKSKPRDN